MREAWADILMYTRLPKDIGAVLVMSDGVRVPLEVPGWEAEDLSDMVKEEKERVKKKISWYRPVNARTALVPCKTKGNMCNNIRIFYQYMSCAFI